MRYDHALKNTGITSEGAKTARSGRRGYDSEWVSGARCCKACTELNGITLKDSFRPPLHGGCSCSVGIGEKTEQEENLTKAKESDKLHSDKWQNAEFVSIARLESHFQKHVNQYGNITIDEYLKMARGLLTADLDSDVVGFIGDAGFVHKYRISTNDFAVGRPDGHISTLYKFDDGIKGWEKDVKDNKPK